MSLHWSQCDFLAIDVEGNGQSPQEIIELAIVPIRQSLIAKPSHVWLIKPTRPVTDRASRIHGIFDSDLADKPEFRDLSSAIANVLGAQAVIGHNVAIDVQLLKVRLPTWEPMVAIDTLKLAKLAIPGADNYTLDSIANHCGLGDSTDRRRHRAESDAQTAAQLFIALVHILEKQGELNLRRLAELSASASDPFFSTTQQSLF